MYWTVANRHGSRWNILVCNSIVLLAGGFCEPALAQSQTAKDLVAEPWVTQAEMADPGRPGDRFGHSVALDGNTLVVGAPDAAVGGEQARGEVYVFVRNGTAWTQQTILNASDGAAGDIFGSSVAVSGSTIVVGAPDRTISSNSNQGVAYIFVENGGTWSQQAELTASDGVANDQFGYSVAVSDTTALVGAFQHSVGMHSQQGAAYVFTQNGTVWAQQAELTASDGAPSDWFGGSVGLSGGTAVVGAYFHKVGSNAGQGSAYVFVQDGTQWTQQAELTASDGAEGAFFGFAAGISGGLAVVGSPYLAVDSNQARGAAYVFARNGTVWTQQAELTASDGMSEDLFGNSVSVNGGTAVATSRYHTVGSNPDQGAGYVFVQNGTAWEQQTELIAPDGESQDFLGSSVAVSGSTIVVGDDYKFSGGGAGYVFVPAVFSVSLSPTSLSYGGQALGGVSRAKTVTVTNTGNDTLSFSGISASANFAVSSTTCGATLAASKTCKVNVTFNPTEVGTLTGTLSFTDNAAGSPQTVALSGKGIADVTLTPATAKYAKQKVGTTSTAKSFTLTNNEATSLTGLAISVNGDFAVSATTCGASLAAKAKCTISVTFTPTQTGTRTGQLNVSDSAGNSPQTAELTGTGT